VHHPGRHVTPSGRQVVLEQVGRLNGVIVDADENQVFKGHL
jgi:hypothetical protein